MGSGRPIDANAWAVAVADQKSTPKPTSDSCASAGAARNFATSGGRTQVLRREVTGMDARQALRPRMGRSARSS
ncbi:hypothetical protein DMX07_21345, partial [Pseudomonas soli]